MTSPVHHAWIGLGANLGRPIELIQTAISTLAQRPDCQLLAHSSFYRTAPVNCEPGQPDYINAVIKLATNHSPQALLALLLKMEQDFGRTRAYRNAPRTLDLDLLLYDNYLIEQPDLQLPHPRMHERAFVLVPLAEISPELHIPGQGKISDLVSRLNDQAIERLFC